MGNLISIIVPIYNVEKYLDRCVKSILAQTYKNIEIILVDDGSPDNCPALCDVYKKKDNRIEVVHKMNGGLSDARNAGMKVANGDFYLFVDSDDYIEPELCEKCMENMKDDIDIISFNFRRVYEDNKETKHGNGSFRVFDNLEGFKRYINRNPFTHMAWDKLYRKRVFEKTEFTVNRLAEDMSTIYKIFGRANKVAHLDSTFYNYYYRSNSIMGGKSLKLVLDAYMGECEAFEYGNVYYTSLERLNNTRFLNQSMKTYLKLVKLYSQTNDVCNARNSVLANIYRIDKKNISIKTRLFYIAFLTSKNIAWKLFNMFHLS